MMNSTLFSTFHYGNPIEKNASNPTRVVSKPWDFSDWTIQTITRHGKCFTYKVPKFIVNLNVKEIRVD